MQFSVPQFTDVEDRIVAGLTLKQFGIVFGTGALIFAFYTLTKSILAVIALIIFLGVPALVVAFGKINGRPIYSAFGTFIRYFTGSKVYIFHKQAQTLHEHKAGTVKIHEQAPPPLGQEAAVTRMKQLNYLLQQQAGEEQTLLDRIAAEKRAQPR
jgi:hypothetical protein